MGTRRIIFLLIAIFVLLVEYLLISFAEVGLSVSFSSFLEIQLLLIYLYICVSAIRKWGVFNIYTLFVLTLGLFNYMKIFYSLFTTDDYRIAYSLIEINLPESVVQEMLFVFTTFTIVIHSSYVYFFKKYNGCITSADTDKDWKYSSNETLFRIGRLVILSSFGFILYRSYIEITFLANSSFTEIYTGGAQTLPIPSFIRTLSVFFQVGYMMILASRPTKKRFIFYSGIFLISIIPYLFIGLRGAFAITILFLLWYYSKVYNHKFKMWKVFVPALSLIILLQVIGITRQDGELTSSILMLLPLFLTYQSQSMYVLALYIQYRDTIMEYPYPFILDPLIGWLTGADGQSLEVLEKRSSLGHQLIYTLNPDYYLSGSSFGTTLIAELYEFGILCVIIGALVFAWFIAKFDYSLKRNRWYLLFSMFLASFILLAPRGTFFPNVYFFLRYGFVFILMMMIYKIVCYSLRNEGKILNKDI